MLKVRGIPELEAAAILFKNADRETRRALAQQSKAWAPTIIRAAKMHAELPQDRAIAGSGRVTVNTKGIVATFGAAGRLGSGTPLREITRPFEFGTQNDDTFTTYLSRQRTTKRAMKVTRRTRKSLPAWNKTGRFLYPAVADTAPELVSRYVRAIALTVSNAR